MTQSEEQADKTAMEIRPSGMKHTLMSPGQEAKSREGFASAIRAEVPRGSERELQVIMLRDSVRNEATISGVILERELRCIGRIDVLLSAGSHGHGFMSFHSRERLRLVAHHPSIASAPVQR